MKVCKYCGSSVQDSERLCPHCGAAEFDHRCEQCGTVFSTPCCPQCGLRAGSKANVCPRCGRTYFSNACPNCGYSALRAGSSGPVQQVQPIRPASPVPPASTFIRSAPTESAASPKSRVVVLILLLLVGWLGVHRFYVGKIGTGILYLLTFGFVGIGLLVDLILILIGTFRDKQGLEVRNW